MPETTLKQLDPVPRLVPIKAKLASPGRPLKCKGQFTAEAEIKQRRYRFRVLITAGTSTDNRLSSSVAVRMGLIRRLDMLNLKDDIFGDIERLDCDLVKIKLPEQSHTVYLWPDASPSLFFQLWKQNFDVLRSMVLSSKLLVRFSPGHDLKRQPVVRLQFGSPVVLESVEPLLNHHCSQVHPGPGW